MIEPSENTEKKSKKNHLTFVLREWNNYVFHLRVPEKPDKDNKIEVYFTFVDPVTKKRKQVKESRGINRRANKDVYTAQANELVDILISNLSEGWNPITGVTPEKSDRLTEKSDISSCIAYVRKHRTADFDSGKIQQGELNAATRVFDLFEAYLKKFNLEREKPSYFTSNDINAFMRYIEPDTTKLIPKKAPNSGLKDTTVNRRIRKPKDKVEDKKPVPLAKSTYNMYLQRLTYLFDQLITERVLVYNPTKGAFKHKTTNLKTRYTIYEADELKLVTDIVKGDDRYKDLEIGIHLLYSYRIRAREQFRIKVGWLDFENNILSIPEETIEKGRKIRSTKNGNAATFMLSDKVITLIKDYLGDRINEPSYFLFGGYKQRLASHFSLRFIELRKKHGLPEHLKFYALKHTSNYNSYETLGIEALSKINRHASISQTQNYIKSKLKKEIISVNSDLEF